MAFGAVAAGVLGIGGALIGSKASKSAAQTQADATNQASATQKAIFDQQVALQEPFRQTGLAANNQLASLMGLGGYSSPSSGYSSPSSGYVAPQTQDQIRNSLIAQYTTTTPATQGQWVGQGQGGVDSYGTWVEGTPGSSTVNEAALNDAVQQRYAQQQQQAQQYTQSQGAQGNQSGTSGAPGSLMQTFNMDQYASNPGYVRKEFTNADFVKDPGYQFRMDEGQKSVQNSAAARGGLLSGAALKAIEQYGQNFASNEFGQAANRFNQNENNKYDQYNSAYGRYTGDQTNQYNRLAGLVNTGMGATNQTANAAANYGNNVSSNQIAAGNANASGTMGSANAITGGISSAYNNYQNNNLMQQYLNKNSTGYGGSGYNTAGNYGTTGLNNFYFGNGTGGD